MPSTLTKDLTPVSCDLSPSQRALWGLYQADRENGAYNINYAWKISRGLDLNVFKWALRILVARHPVWRSTYHLVDGVPVQKIHQTMNLSFREINAEQWSWAHLLQTIEEEIYRPFDLETEPPVRWRYYRRQEESVLFLHLQHIGTDLWSVMTFMNQLGDLLNTPRGEETTHAKLTEIPKVDSEALVTQYLSGPKAKEDRDYWEKRLRGASQVLNFPEDFTRPPLPSVKGGYIRFPLKDELVQNLSNLARQRSVSPFVLYLSAFQIMLHRITGQKDILVGVPTAGRDQTHAPILGYFVNPIAVRSQFPGSVSFAEFLEAHAPLILEDLSHGNYPFHLLAKGLGPHHDSSRTPVFQTSFVWENANRFENRDHPMITLDGQHREIWSVGPMTWERIPLKPQLDFFDFTLKMSKCGDRLYGNLEYSEALFSAENMQRLPAVFLTLLEALVQQPDAPLTRLPMLPAEERRRQLQHFNTTAETPPPASTLHQPFEDRAEKLPHAIALVSNQSMLSYAALNQRANQWGRWLQSQGVGPDQTVGIYMVRCPEMAIAVLAVLKAGAAYVPLDPSHPPARREIIIQDTGLALVLTQQCLLADLAEAKARLVCLDKKPLPVNSWSGTPFPCPAQDQNLAYVIYTSGSTGRPKGTLIHHRGAVNYLAWSSKAYPLERGMGAAVHSSLTFDLTVTGFFAPLWVGKAVHLLPQEQGPETLGKALRKGHRFSLIKLTPSHLELLAEQLSVAQMRRCTESFVVGGENLNAEKLASWRQHAPHTALFNEYGPTETVVGCCVHRVGPDTSNRGSVPIGVPIANTELYVLDANMEPMPQGAHGELFIGGVGLARGYHQRPGLTARCFVPNPFSKRPGSRLYKTGDLVRAIGSKAREPFQLEFLGRRDNQVKLRGFRIELSEIETALNEHPGVKASAVLLEGERVGKMLVAYVAAKEHSELTPEQLKGFLQQILPQYMIPAKTIILSQLPLTDNGKVDWRRLRSLGDQEAEEPAVKSPPGNPVEACLHQIWQEVLGLNAIGIHDNFFHLGGDSILGFMVVSRALRQGLKVTPKKILQFPTIAQLAKEAHTVKTEKIEQGPVTGVVPLTPVQKWFFKLPMEERHHWNMAMMVSMPSHLQVAELEKAFNILARHHDALRLRFQLKGGQWHQSIEPPQESEILTLFDGSALDPEYHSRAVDLCADGLQRKFHLSKGPLMGAVLFNFGPQGPTRLLIAVHHLVMDGVSWRIFLEDLELAYRLLGQQKPPRLAAKTTSFKQWAENLNSHAQAPSVKSEWAFWQEFTKLPAVNIPRDFAGSQNRIASQKKISTTLDRKATAALLLETPKPYRNKITEVLAAALAECLGEWTKSPDLLVDLEGHGRETWRDDQDLSRTIGWFTTMYPVLLTGGGGPADLLKRTKETFRAIPNQGFGFSLLEQDPSSDEGKRLAEALPPRQVLFNYLGRFESNPNQPFAILDEPVGQTRSPSSARSHLLEIVGLIVDDCLRLDWYFSTDCHRSETIEKLAKGYRNSLISLIEHCQTEGAGGFTPSDFPTLAFRQDELDRLPQALSERGFNQNLELQDVLSLAPMQRGMLVHTLMSEEADAYLVQTWWQLQGLLDPKSFHNAWLSVMNRHSALRCAFFEDLADQPFQVIAGNIRLPFTCHDHRELEPEQQEIKLSAFQEKDRRNGFSLAQPPLLRLNLFRLQDDLYRMLWTHHHLIMDGWSLPLVLSQVWKAYENEGQYPKSEKPPQPFAKYIQWVQEQDRTAAKSYWNHLLKNFSGPTPLGIGHMPEISRKASSNAGRQDRFPNRSACIEVQTFSKARGLTLNTLAQGALGLLLHRYSREGAVLFGSTVSGRPPELDGVESMVGLFINTLPLIAKFEPGDRGSTWLGELQEQFTESRRFEYDSLADIQSCSGIPADQPLFQAVLIFENYPGSLSASGGQLQCRFLEDVESTNFPINLVILAQEQSWHLRLVYDRSRISDRAAKAFLAHFETLLVALVRDPDEPLSNLEMVNAEDRSRILNRWNDTAADYREDPPFHLRVTHWARTTPDAVALVGETTSMTYQTLDGRANELAHRLQKRGICPDSLVGICMERSPSMIVAILAIFKAGAAYLPLDPDYPGQRLAYMVDDARPGLILTTENARQSLPTNGITKWVLPERPISRDLAASPPPTYLLKGNLAYVIYTSGSTGQPKGVQVSHGALRHLLKTQRQALKPTRNDRVLKFNSLNFDAAIYWISLALQSGATLFVPKSEHLIGENLIHYMRDRAITTTVINPSILAALPHEPLPALQNLHVAGEACSRELAAKWSKSRNLFNAYGPTEASVWATYAIVDGSETPPIGRPVANTCVVLADLSLKLVPPGICGEILIGGHGLARGYLGKPALTAERFVPNPYQIGGSRLYKSGDLGRYRMDGQIEFLGRLDQQVKIRGFRIELEEIQAALEDHPQIADALVLVDEHQGLQRLNAFFICASPDRDRLLQALDFIPHQNLGFVAWREPEPFAKLKKAAASESDSDIQHIENQLKAIPELVDVAVIPKPRDKEKTYTVHFLVDSVDARQIRSFLQNKLPDYMVPTSFNPLLGFPLTPNGKVDRKALLSKLKTQGLQSTEALAGKEPQNRVERVIAEIWQAALQLPQIDRQTSFFNLGGHSLLILQVRNQLQRALGRKIAIADLFQYPTIASLSRYLAPRSEGATEQTPQHLETPVSDIAVIGMSGRFPGAPSIEQYWENLKNSVESITFFTAEELIAEGIDTDQLTNPDYVRARGILQDPDLFDPVFFGLTPREAEILDPQQRLALEIAWEAMENAGYDPINYPGAIGVFAGSSISTYLQHNLLGNDSLVEQIGSFQLIMGNDKDFLPTRISYHLNLKGPSINVQTACSTSLVAIHQACQSIARGECQMALAGGVSVQVPQRSGYLYQEGGIFSPDGHCRAFDAQAAGMLGGNGLGMLVLKGLEHALADGDTIRAVIKGSAINNDGNAKVGFTAPSVSGQAEAISKALQRAGAEPQSLTYVEAHGTGTALGDPIEIAALNKAFGKLPDHRCAIGSVKTNFGHLDAAAGVAGVIKTVLSLENRQIPSSLHFDAANPEICFEEGPFYVNHKLAQWPGNQYPRRAGVSSFGIGGTNAHLILEEAPICSSRPSEKPWQLLPWSAKSSPSLDAATQNLYTYLSHAAEQPLADVAFTLQTGRHGFNNRRFLVCGTRSEAAAMLADSQSKNVYSHSGPSSQQPLVFMFSGQGSQYPLMAQEFYRYEPVFRDEFDRCMTLLKEIDGPDLMAVLYPDQNPQSEEQGALLNRTDITQPALFVVEFALAKWWMHLGMKPEALIGHSIGEYVAACLAGVFSLRDALTLVVARGKLMQKLPGGTMLAVPLSAEAVQPLLETTVNLAAINGPNRCVLSGPDHALAKVQEQLQKQEIRSFKLHTSHAFHSAMMDPILKPFEDVVRSLDLKPPQIPFISNVTGKQAEAHMVTTPSYWVDHLRGTVRFFEGLKELAKSQSGVFLEVGPGRSLATLAKTCVGSQSPIKILTTLPHPQDRGADTAHALNSLGKLWLYGFDPNWQALHGNEKRQRIPLPTYPFERGRYWVTPSRKKSRTCIETPKGHRSKMKDWFYLPSWRRTPTLADDPESSPEPKRWLLFKDLLHLAEDLKAELESRGHRVWMVEPGKAFKRVNDQYFQVRPDQLKDYHQLFQCLEQEAGLPQQLVHMAGLGALKTAYPDLANLDRDLELGYYHLLFLAQALEQQNWQTPFGFTVVTDGLNQVFPGDLVKPLRAPLLGPAMVLSKEIPDCRCKVIDLETHDQAVKTKLPTLLGEIVSRTGDLNVSYRRGSRWVPRVQPFPLEESGPPNGTVRQTGVYLITGGLGGIGLILAEYLAAQYKARLILTRRSPFPPRSQWPETLESEGGSENAAIIRRLLAMEAQGAEIQATSVDVTDETNMNRMIDRARQTWGAVNGVFHAAGVGPSGPLSGQKRESVSRVLDPKIRGTLILHKLFAPQDLDFMVLFSSTSALLGNMGFGDYIAANGFLDAFATYRTTQTGAETLSINWDGWRDGGMGQDDGAAKVNGNAGDHGLSAREGMEALGRILGQRGLERIVVSTWPLEPMLADIEKFLRSTHQPPSSPKHENSSQAIRAQPFMDTLVAQTASATERVVAELWQEALGFEKVGVSDSFFELGGDSLLATVVASKLKRRFGVKINPDTLNSHPTLGELAKAIDELTNGPLPLSKQVKPVGTGTTKEPEQILSLSEKKPISSQERQLARIWSQELGHAEALGEKDLYPLVDGSSKEQRLLERLNQNFDLNLPVDFLQQFSRLRDQAEAIASLVWAKSQLESATELNPKSSKGEPS